MTVTRRDLEGLLSSLTAKVRDPREGLFGPQSVSWKINREVALMAGGGRAVLLQLAHPYVAHAIAQHSPTKTDFQGRFVRTFTNIFSLIYGDVPTVVDTARRVHKIHARIRGPITEGSHAHPHGSRYEANNEQALLWVFATLVDTSIQVHNLLLEPLTGDEITRYYEDAKVFGHLFGIPRAVMPRDYASFHSYVERTLASDTLHVTEQARDMAHFLLEPPSRLLAPAMSAYRVFTAGLLPPHIREAYGFKTQKLAFTLATQALRTFFAGLPRRLRYFPAYVTAKRRLQGKGPDRVGELIEELVVRSLPHAS